MSQNEHKRWVLELHKELRQIVGETKFSLPRPAITLHQSESVWGRWDPLNLSISLSIAVIETCSWRVVVEILKHEVAHQLTDYLYGSCALPHGVEFQSVCKLLRVEDWARRASSGKSLHELSMLSNWKQDKESETNIRYQRRLEKLLALADSTSEHEAMVAMRRAQELQDQHRLSGRKVKKKSRPLVNLEIGAGKQRHAPYEGRIASILMSHFHVDVVFATRFSVKTEAPEAIIDLLGRREDVLLAEYVHGFLHRSARGLWLEKRQKTGAKGVRARNSYIRGLLAGFDAKLSEENPERARGREVTHRATQALVRADGQERSEFVKARYPRLSARRSSARIDQSAYRDGKSAGSKLSMRRPVTSGGARNKGRLLPG
jgi:predicted SprT family Zn-dependent metalloprotease